MKFGQLARIAVGSGLLALASKLLMLLTSVVLARAMGASGYGIYATTMALVWLLTVLVGLGLPTLLVRLLASYRVEQQWRLMLGILRFSNRTVLFASALVMIGAATLLLLIESAISPGLCNSLKLALLLVPLTALGAIRSTALRGLHHVILGQLPESLITPMLFLSLVYLCSTLSGGGAAILPELAILMRIAAVIVAFIVGAYALHRCMPNEMKVSQPEYRSREWFAATLPLLFIGGIHIINTQADVIMLAIFSGSDSAGIYQASARTAELVAFSLVIANVVVQPSLAKYFTAGDMLKLQKIATAAARSATALAVPLASIMILWGEDALMAVYGPDFGLGFEALAILSLAQIINAFMGPSASVLDMTGHQRETLQIMIIGVVANLLLNLILIPKLDMTGAALSTGASLIIWNALLVYKAKKKVGIASAAIRL